jgi:hypothetical protein
MESQSVSSSALTPFVSRCPQTHQPVQRQQIGIQVDELGKMEQTQLLRRQNKDCLGKSLCESHSRMPQSFNIGSYLLGLSHFHSEGVDFFHQLLFEFTF